MRTSSFYREQPRLINPGDDCTFYLLRRSAKRPFLVDLLNAAAHKQWCFFFWWNNFLKGMSNHDDDCALLFWWLLVHSAEVGKNNYWMRIWHCSSVVQCCWQWRSLPRCSSRSSVLLCTADQVAILSFSESRCRQSGWGRGGLRFVRSIVGMQPLPSLADIFFSFFSPLII